MLRRALLLAVVAAAVTAAPSAARVKPVAALSGPAIIKAGTRATFNAISSTHDPAGEIVEYAWDLDGSGKFDDIRKGPTITALMEDAGEITVSVRVTDDVGASSVAVGHFLVEGEPPTARLSVPAPVVAGTPVTLDAAGSSSPSGEIVAYAWDLDGAGFGADSEAPTVTTTFPEPGPVTVRLRVRDAAEGERVLRQVIDVVAPGGPAADPAGVGGDPQAGVAPLDSAAQRWIRAGSSRHFAAINGAARRSLRSVRRNGLWINLLADRAVRFRFDVLLTRGAARRLGLRGVPASSGRVRVARVATRLPVAGQRAFRLALPRRVRHVLRTPVTLLIRATATDGLGHRALVSRAFSLRR